MHFFPWETHFGVYVVVDVVLFGCAAGRWGLRGRDGASAAQSGGGAADVAGCRGCVLSVGVVS